MKPPTSHPPALLALASILAASLAAPACSGSDDAPAALDSPSPPTQDGGLDANASDAKAHTDAAQLDAKAPPAKHDAAADAKVDTAPHSLDAGLLPDAFAGIDASIPDALPPLPDAGPSLDASLFPDGFPHFDAGAFVIDGGFDLGAIFKDGGIDFSALMDGGLGGLCIPPAGVSCSPGSFSDTSSMCGGKGALWSCGGSTNVDDFKCILPTGCSSVSGAGTPHFCCQ